MQEIKSLKDRRIQFARSLSTRKGRAESGKFLVEGVEAIRWARKAGVTIHHVFVAPNATGHESLASLPLFRVSEGLLKKITGTSYLRPIVAVGERTATPGDPSFQVVLDGVKDVGNIGTIIRTCHAFGINGLIGTDRELDLYHRKTVDASRGKVFATDCRCFDSPEEAARHLKAQGCQIVTTSPYGDRIQSLAELADKPVALVVGNETHGASQALMDEADLVVQIPMQSEMESLNVGVATGISIYELKLKQVIGMIERKIKSTVGREINVAGMLLQQALDSELKKVSSFSSRQIVFMMVLKCDITMTKEAMQKQFGIMDEDVSPFLTPLKGQGLIATDADTLAITEKGAETLSKLWTVVENTENMAFQDVSPEERALFTSLLSKIQANCLKIMQAHE